MCRNYIYLGIWIKYLTITISLVTTITINAEKYDSAHSFSNIQRLRVTENTRVTI
ncbi:hypothetical protein NARC_10378 [Candidatus Nitrosocosmicus arcticus]|uniref:Uncharacterized protein n=1 Tax=Candidatus Nitrosocosmicus arcticus TaxID=2035267 RepID=A0A557SZD9_9ARCH|nr:hypothetical protein NARC_10378 [Candidatus Nitrosocosmicus arcticus]